MPGPSTETVKFGVKQSSIDFVSHHDFLRTTTLGVGRLVVPAPVGEVAKSKVATGSFRFSSIKFSAHDVLLLDEDKFSLKVAHGTFYSAKFHNDGLQINLVVTVTKSLTTHSCPDGSRGQVNLFDGSLGHKPDSIEVRIPACGVHRFYVQGKDHAQVAVVIQENKAKQPA